MTFWRRFFTKTECVVGFGTRDCEPARRHADLWVSSRDPAQIAELARFCVRRRLPIAGWCARVATAQDSGMLVAAELVRAGANVTILAPADHHRVILARLQAHGCSFDEGRLIVVSDTLEVFT